MPRPPTPQVEVPLTGCKQTSQAMTPWECKSALGAANPGVVQGTPAHVWQSLSQVNGELPEPPPCVPS